MSRLKYAAFAAFSYSLLLPLIACGAPSSDPRLRLATSAPLPSASLSNVGSADPNSSAPTKPETPAERATEFVQDCSNGHFDHAIGMFDPDMAKAMSASALSNTWREIIQTAGPIGECEKASVATDGAYTVVVLPCKFEHQPLNVKVALDSQSRIAGLFFLPAQPPYSPPPYAARDAIERDVTVGKPPYPLPGTLTLPPGKGPFPGVVLVQGSGPADRDESVGPNRPFKDIALGLAAKGIASLRFDKRTRVYGAALKAAYEAALPDSMSFTVNDETVNDAAAAIAMLEGAPEIDKRHVFVVGHSLGGELAPRIALGAPELAGIAILAGSTRPIADMMIEQLKYVDGLDGKTSPEEARELAKVESARSRIQEIVNGSAAKPKESILGAPPSYWIDLSTYDAPTVAAKLTMAIFVLQGGRDYQVSTVDYHAWEKALAKRPHVMKKLYPKLDHLFFAGEEKSVPEEYEIASHVDEEVIRDLAAWVKKPK